MRVGAVLSVICLVLVAGCGEVAFKQGGDTAALQAAKANCRQQGGDEAAYRACLDASGWTVVKPSVSYQKPAAASGAAEPVNAPASTESPPLAAAADANGPVTVSSWWKLGAGDGAFHADMTACGDAEATPSHQLPATVVACMEGRGWSAFRAN